MADQATQQPGTQAAQQVPAAASVSAAPVLSATPTPTPTPIPTPSAPADAPTLTAGVAQPAGQVDDDEKFFAALGYFAFLFVVPLIVKPKSAYCKFHARQSMVLFLVSILVLVFLAATPMIGSLLTLALFAVYVLVIYKAYKGDLWAIPFVSKFAGKMDVEALYGKAGLAVSGISGLKDKAASMAEQAGQTMKDLGKQDDESKQSPPEVPSASPPVPPASSVPPTA